jgi:hypothetical protein
VERDPLFGAKQATAQPRDVSRLCERIAMLEESVHENAEQAI